MFLYFCCSHSTSAFYIIWDSVFNLNLSSDKHSVWERRRARRSFWTHLCRWCRCRWCSVGRFRARALRSPRWRCGWCPTARAWHLCGRSAARTGVPVHFRPRWSRTRGPARASPAASRATAPPPPRTTRAPSRTSRKTPPRCASSRTASLQTLPTKFL